jgi:hypothetical protein
MKSLAQATDAACQRESYANRAALVFLLLVGFLSGCVTDHDRQAFDEKFFWSDRSSFAGKMSAERACEWANNPALDPEVRASAVAILFANFVKPGFSSEQMRPAIPDNRWLQACSVSDCSASGGGGQLIYHQTGTSFFELRLFPDATGWSDWVINFNLSGSDWPGGAVTSEQALAFLSGKEQNKRVRLLEFAIWYPICGSRASPTTQVYLWERFTGKRVGVILPFH